MGGNVAILLGERNGYLGTGSIVVRNVGNHVPQLRLWWDKNKVDITIDEVITRLRTGHPSIETMKKAWVGEGLVVNMWMAQPGQERVVARRPSKVLEEAAI